jgi:hypothetical protein
MQSFADSASIKQARDCRYRSGKILPIHFAQGSNCVPRSAIELFSQNVSALVRHYQDAHPDLTLAEIAQRMGLSLRTLRNARVGEHAATLDTAETVARFFELEIWQLFMEDLPAEILLNPRLARIVRNVVRAAVQERIEERTGTR